MEDGKDSPQNGDDSDKQIKWPQQKRLERVPVLVDADARGIVAVAFRREYEKPEAQSRKRIPPRVDAVPEKAVLVFAVHHENNKPQKRLQKSVRALQKYIRDSSHRSSQNHPAMIPHRFAARNSKIRYSFGELSLTFRNVS